VPPERVELRVTEGCLTIAGARPATSLEGALLSHRERECGSFHRSLTLPQAVVPESVQAEYRHGTYQIRLFKKLQAEPPVQDSTPAEP
jgi:HSP20 family molecular chaperone IbpA